MRKNILILLVMVFVLNSCNTAIGVYRDTRQGYYWTKGKVQNMVGSSGSSSSGSYGGAPVY